MLFYEDFLKKLESANFNIGDREVFNVEIKKMISALGVGIALITIGIFQIYMSYLRQGNLGKGIFGAVLLFFAYRQFRVIFIYRMTIDCINKVLKSNKAVINLNEVESCTLKEAKVGKHIETVVDIITDDKKQFIIPFYMNKKIKFAYVLKKLLGNKFIIKTK